MDFIFIICNEDSVYITVEETPLFSCLASDFPAFIAAEILLIKEGKESKFPVEKFVSIIINIIDNTFRYDVKAVVDEINKFSSFLMEFKSLKVSVDDGNDIDYSAPRCHCGCRGGHWKQQLIQKLLPLF